MRYIYLFIFWLLTVTAFGQLSCTICPQQPSCGNAVTCVPNYVPRPQQDCVNALPLCDTINGPFQTSYCGMGDITCEINAVNSCLRSGEKNSVWYKFTARTGGFVNFSIIPVTLSDDYDWAVYRLPSGVNDTISCGLIFNFPFLEVSCNYSGTPGPTGPNGQGGAQNNPVLPVNAGDFFVLNISNFEQNALTGYTIDFTGSTAAIVLPSDPYQLDTITQIPTCGNSSLSFRFNREIMCDSVKKNNFSIINLDDPTFVVQIDTVTAVNCRGQFSKEFNIPFRPIKPGRYSLMQIIPVRDICSFQTSLDTIDFEIPPFVTVKAESPHGCAGSVINLEAVMDSNTSRYNPAGSASFRWKIFNYRTNVWEPLFNPNQDSIQRAGFDSVLVFNARNYGNVIYRMKIMALINLTNGCLDSNVLDMQINPPPAVSVTPTVYACEGDEIFMAVTRPMPPGFKYSWRATGTTSNRRSNDREFRYRADVLIPREFYELTVTDTATSSLSQCRTFLPRGVEVNIARFSEAKFRYEILSTRQNSFPVTIGFINMTRLVPYNETNMVYIWDFGDGSKDTTYNINDTAYHTFTKVPTSGEPFFDAEVTLYSFDTTGLEIFNSPRPYSPKCYSFTKNNIRIFVQRIPNVLTKGSQDSFNDSWLVHGISDNNELRVYNRWGTAVLVKPDFNGNSTVLNGLDPGTYFYHIYDRVNKETKTGWVEILD